MQTAGWYEDAKGVAKISPIYTSSVPRGQLWWLWGVPPQKKPLRILKQGKGGTNPVGAASGGCPGAVPSHPIPLQPTHPVPPHPLPPWPYKGWQCSTSSPRHAAPNPIAPLPAWPGFHHRSPTGTSLTPPDPKPNPDPKPAFTPLGTPPGPHPRPHNPSPAALRRLLRTPPSLGSSPGGHR